MQTEVAIYPAREQYFSHRFTRLMARVCLAGEIGPEACWLLSVIVNTEDAAKYRRAVTFFNGQLADIIGRTVPGLDRFRTKAVKAGWLHYEPGRRHRPGKYWVMIPMHCENIHDGPLDHDSGNYKNGSPSDDRGDATVQAEKNVASYLHASGGKVELNGELPTHQRKETDEETAGAAIDKPVTYTPAEGNAQLLAHEWKESVEVTVQEANADGDAQDHYLHASGREADAKRSAIIPIPDPITEDPPNPPEAGGDVKQTKVRSRRRRSTEPAVPRERDLLFEAVVEVTGLDPETARGKINSACGMLRNAAVPYSPDEVREFGRHFWELCPYAAQQGNLRERPYPHELATYIGRLRAGPAPPQRRPQFIGGRAATETDIAERSLLAAIPIYANAEGEFE